MGFGILLRDPGSTYQGAFESLLEDTAYSLAKNNPDTDWQSAESIDAGFGKRPPKAVIHFLPEQLSSLKNSDESALFALAEVCSKRKIPLLHVSSYRVYGDEYIEKGWRESDEPEPGGSLGKKLLSLEKGLSDLHNKHIILRPGWILEGKSGLLDHFLPPMLEGKSPVVSDHRYGSPLPRRFVARVLFAMIQQILCGANNWGVFNIHSSDKCSEAEFADQLYRLLVNEFKLDVKLPTVAGADDERYFVEGCAHLLGRRCTANFGIQFPTWRSGFARVVKAWLDEARAIELTEEG